MWQHANRKRASGAYLHWSIQKYGINNFKIEQLHEFDNPTHAKDKERELIAKLQLNRCRHPTGVGMNLTDGGDGSYGCKHLSSSIEKMSGANNHNYGLTGALNPTSKAVHQLDKSGAIIATFGSMHEAARHLIPGCSPKQASTVASNIRTVIRGRSLSKYAYGYGWADATVDCSPTE